MDKKRRVSFEECTGGEEFGPFKYTITPKIVKWYAEGVDDFHPWYIQQTKDTPFGARIVHPTFCHVLKLFCWSVIPGLEKEGAPRTAESSGSTPDIARLHCAYGAEYFDVIRVGETVTARCKCLKQYLKRGRRYSDWEFEIYGEDGRHICRYIDTTLHGYAKEE